MSRTVWCVTLLALFRSADAQNWSSINLPTQIIDWGVIVHDTLHDALYATGINQIIPGQAGLFRATGNEWDTIGYFSSQGVRSIVLYDDTLIVGGIFYTAGPDSIRACAYYNGSNWLAFGEFNGGINNVRVLDGELYAVGTFSMVDGQPADGIAKRVGGHWEPVGDFGVVPDPYLSDVIKYNGDLICCGNMSINGETYRDVYIYQNSEWGPLGGGLFGTLSGGWVMTIYHDELILGGNFYIGAGNAGQCIMRWNGSSWQPLGVGTTDNTDSYSSSYNIHALCVHDDKLFVGGGFSYAGHVPAKGIATWDGSQWCGLGSDLGLVHDIVFFHDTLYAMCGNHWIDGEYNTGGVKYLHTTFGDTCSLSVGIAPAHTATPEPTLVVKDGRVLVSGLPDGSAMYSLTDAMGRTVLEGTTMSSGGASQPINVNHFKPGSYILRLRNFLALRFVIGWD